MFLTALVLLTLAEPNRWIRVGGSANRYEEYLDKESLRRSGNKVSLWTRRNYRGARSTSWNEIEFDCAAKTETLVAWIRDDDGVVSHNVVRPHRGAARVQPKSVEEKIFNLACR
jgi:hypothetical protein